MGVEPGTPLLSVERTGWAEDLRFEYSVDLFRGEPHAHRHAYDGHDPRGLARRGRRRRRSALGLTSALGSLLVDQMVARGDRTVDCVVVGAGYAGLTAALRLHRAGSSVAVLEGRDRVGGRVFTHVARDGTRLDLGGTWIGAVQDRAYALAAELGVGTYPTFETGEKLYVVDGEPRRYPREHRRGRAPPRPASGRPCGGSTRSPPSSPSTRRGTRGARLSGMGSPPPPGSPPRSKTRGRATSSSAG